MAGSGARRPWWTALVLAVAVVALARCGAAPEPGPGPDGPSDRAATSAPPVPPVPSATASPSATVPAPATSSAPASVYDPADFAAPVRTYSGRAGISARLLMAILYNEAYKPHDPALERAWQRHKPGASFGIANMHRAAFDDTKRGRDFAGRRWEELPDDRDLAIEAAAWHLHDLAARLPADRSGSYGKDELLALGYNAGAGNMLAFARGVAPGSQAASYVGRLRANWAKSGDAVRK
ncbi:lytic transglycosylase domain-containing protein [Streptomyces sp. NBC_01429]|uniref:lytic transglycosylase domain-containing protein n=1 Tax=Streptomyces sp. NBC_01429 TaxID=2903862 RepID=UPI002E27D046|nr:lytic transglycosylase domain-containing protein [Streptomyces sp. NBC_01429]